MRQPLSEAVLPQANGKQSRLASLLNNPGRLPFLAKNEPLNEPLRVQRKVAGCILTESSESSIFG
jgi:hypothetical protein